MQGENEMDGSMFIGTWWSLVPPLLAIVLALVTKEVYSSLFIGVAAGALLYTGFHPWNAFVAFFDIMKNSMNLNILIFDVLLGMIIVLMSKSGGSAAYGKWAGSKIKSKKSAMLATTGLGVLIFVDDYFNCLTVGSVMRPVTDRYKVSRAKLAYIIDATAAPVCIIAPISSWAAAVNSYVPDDAGITGFQLFLSTIPYNLYAILTLVMVVFIIMTGLDFGLMKVHERNAARGDLFTSGGEEFDQVKDEEISANGKSHRSCAAGTGTYRICNRGNDLYRIPWWSNRYRDCFFWLRCRDQLDLCYDDHGIFMLILYLHAKWLPLRDLWTAL